MSSLYKKAELAANIAIILVSIALAVVLVQRFFFATPNKLPSKIAIGSRISLPDVDWSKHNKTLLLILQKDCRYCSESAPFYQRLTKTPVEKNIGLIAVLPGSLDASRSYLNELGVTVSDVRQSKLSLLNVSGTPTLVLVNERGEVIQSWVGKLSADEELNVIASL